MPGSAGRICTTVLVVALTGAGAAQGASPAERLAVEAESLRQLRDGQVEALAWAETTGSPLALRVRLVAARACHDPLAEAHAYGLLLPWLPPLAGVTLPPAAERPAPPDPNGYIWAVIASRLTEPERIVEAVADLTSRPIGELTWALPWARCAAAVDTGRDYPSEGRFVLEIIETHSPREALAYKIHYLKLRLAENPVPAGPVLDLVREIGERLARPGNAGLLASAREYAPEVVALTEADPVVRERRRLLPSLAEEDPTLYALTYGPREVSLEAAGWYEERGEPIGALVRQFWESRPEVE